MSDTPTDNKIVENDATSEDISKGFNRLVAKAWTAEFIERAIPKALPPLLVTSAFLATSWTGLWAVAPLAVKVAGSLLFTTSLAWSPFFLKSKSLRVTRNDALKRIDRNLGEISETPAQTLDDALNVEYSNEIHKELWKTNLKQTWDKWGGKLQAGKIDAGLGLTKFWKGALIAAFSATAIVGTVVRDKPLDDIKQAFDWNIQFNDAATDTQQAPEHLELKAWLSPPDGIVSRDVQYYDQDTADHNNGGKKMVAHEQSTLTILVKDHATDIVVNGQTIALTKTMRSGSLKDPKTTYVYEVPFADKDVTVAIKGGPTWQFIVEQDNAPTVGIDGVRIGPDGIEIDYTADDDEGIKSGEIRIVPPKEDGKRTLPSSGFPTTPIHQ